MPHKRMTRPLDPKHVSHLYIWGGSVAILDYVVHTSVLDQGDPMDRPGPAGPGPGSGSDPDQ